MPDTRTPLDAGMDAWLAHHPNRPATADAVVLVKAILDAAGPLIAAAALRESAAEAAVARVRDLCATARGMGAMAGPDGHLGHLTVGEVLAALNGDDA